MSPRLRPAIVVGAIVATLALPFALAAGLHSWGWRPASDGAHGRLIEPPRPLPAAGLVAADGAPLATETLHGHWWLLLVGRGPCASECMGHADEMRRIHVALNRDMPRLKRMLLTDAPTESAAALRAAQPDLVVARPDAAWSAALDTREFRYFVLDPQARVLLRYPADAQPAGVHEDLARLLRYSTAG